jgi:mannose-1-phosphate guanylyltransferase
MAGGIGSRFWPASNDNFPKQFLDILGVGKSLLRLTFERFNKQFPAENILILTNGKYKSLVQEHVPEVPENNILLEPSRNNTAPCIAYAALKLFHKNKKAAFCVAPSDAVILKEDIFLEKLNKAFEFVESQTAIVTLGIQPSRPDTGYGYIEVDPEDVTLGDNLMKVSSFKEKPNHTVAKKYLSLGNYFWNAGIFIWSSETIIESFRENANEILLTLTRDVSKFNTDEEQEYINEVYPLCPKISVDYAILEKDPNIFTIPADIGWSDLGTWQSLYAYLDKDENENVIQLQRGQVIDCTGSFVKISDDKEVLIKGLENYIIIDSVEGLLIFPKSDEQEIKSRRKKD